MKDLQNFDKTDEPYEKSKGNEVKQNHKTIKIFE